ncbi:MAG: Yip1 family protein [Caulobacteraceae bacterium]
MSVVEGPRSTGLVARIQAILFRPAAEWEVIDAEPATTRGLFIGYAAILAAIPAIAGLIGRQVFGYGAFGISYHPPLVASIVGAIVGYILALISVFILGLIIDALAPSFDGQKDQVKAMKVAVYSSTAGWVAGILMLFPPLGIIALLGGLYGLYLLYLGLPRLMKSPPAKALGYTVVTVVAAIVLYFIVGVVVTAVGGMALFGGMAAGGYHTANYAAPSGTVRVNGATIDLGRMQAAAASAAAISRAQANGKAVAAVDPERLKALLPASVAGMTRTELNAETASAAGMSGSNAEAVYQKDAARVTVRVVDLAAAGALAGMAGAMNVTADKQTATGYEKIGKVGGRMTTESWDRGSNSGKYSVLVADRFTVEAEGSGTTMDTLKSAVAAVGPDRLEGLAKS